MCGRFSLDRFPSSIVEALIDCEVSFSLREKLYPSNEVDVVFRGVRGNEMAVMKWRL